MIPPEPNPPLNVILFAKFQAPVTLSSPTFLAYCELKSLPQLKLFRSAPVFEIFVQSIFALEEISAFKIDPSTIEPERIFPCAASNCFLSDPLKSRSTGAEPVAFTFKSR